MSSLVSPYVGSDSHAELMAEHPDTKYIVNTNDPDFWGDLAMSVLPTIEMCIRDRAQVDYLVDRRQVQGRRRPQPSRTNRPSSSGTAPRGPRD